MTRYILCLILLATASSASLPPVVTLSGTPPTARVAASDMPTSPSGGGLAGGVPPEVRTRIVAEMVAAVLARRGVISHMGKTAVPRSYLALPCKKPNNTHCGLLVTLCGPAACKVMRQTDYGPSQRVHPNRIADVHPATFTELCGVPASAGLCKGTWTTATLTLPDTSTEGEP